MRFNGKDLMHVHRAISIAKEIPPGMPARDITTVAASRGEDVANVATIQDVYTVRVNIACRSVEEAWRVRGLLAAWATSSGNVAAELEPTRTPGKAYSAIARSISRPEFKFGFATVDVEFMLPRPVMHDMTQKTASKTGAESMSFMIGGTASVQPSFSFAPDANVNGLSLTMDGKTFFRYKGRMNAGSTLEVVLETGAVLVDGEHDEPNIVYTDTDFDIELKPGSHTLGATAAGTLRARWRDEWQ